MRPVGAPRAQSTCSHCGGPMPEPCAPQRRHCSQACRQAAYEARNGRSQSDERAAAIVSAWSLERREALKALCRLYEWQQLGRVEARIVARLMRLVRTAPLQPLAKVKAAHIVAFDSHPYPMRRLYCLEQANDSSAAALALAVRRMWTVLGREPAEHPDGALTALLGSLAVEGRYAVAEMLCDSLYGYEWRDTRAPPA